MDKKNKAVGSFLRNMVLGGRVVGCGGGQSREKPLVTWEVEFPTLDTLHPTGLRVELFIVCDGYFGA